MRIVLPAVAVAEALSGVAAASGALPPPVDCATLPNPVYIQCGDTQINLMLNLGRALRGNATPITLVWVTSPSCTNIDLMYLGGNIGGGGNGGIETTMSYVPSLTEDATWQPSDGPATCNLPPGGVRPDIGNSALYITACDPPPQPANVYIGGSLPSQLGQTQTGSMSPKQGYALAMPRGAGTSAISAAEAYFLFGFGPTMLSALHAALSPWVDPMQVFIRAGGTSTLLAWGLNLQIPANKFQGVQEPGSPQVVSALEGSTDPSAAIGMVGLEVYDALRAQLQVLAFQAYHQYAAYYPDSTPTSFDKQNLRDGHYTVWSPAVWMDFTDGVPTPDYPQGTPRNQYARYVIDLIDNQDTSLTGIAPPTTFDTQVIIAQVGLVPDCAMRVQRAFEGGPLSLYTPPTSCTCKFLGAVDVSPCATCSASAPCASGVCRDGYCEDF